MMGLEELAHAGAKALELGLETAWKAIEQGLRGDHPELRTDDTMAAAGDAMSHARDEALARARKP